MYTKTAQLVILVLLTISLQNPRSVNGEDDLVTRLCKSTSSSGECIDCVASVSVGRGIPTTDIGVVEDVMACGTNAIDHLYQDAYAYKSKATDPALKDALDVCHDRGEAAKQSINNQVTKDVRIRHFVSAKAIIISQIQTVNSCAHAAKSKGVQLPQEMYRDLEIVNNIWSGMVLKMLDSLF
ncbi:hypothetical protein RND81_13G138100 [Saponaria officinalis]|uniref:Pectinesterase inhibitor domain-containing protein n=1 Tax=Saponaria officinalis TaxID=3572 RepID=A0AAW1H0R3_SAPOF